MRSLHVNGTHLFIAPDYDQLSKWAAFDILTRTQKNPRINLLVPTGTTPKDMYSYLRKEKENPFRFSKFFNFDEYCMKSGSRYIMFDSRNPVSYRNYMNKHLFTTHCPEEKYFPTWMEGEKEGLYDELMKNEGGIDFCVAPLGEDGHTFGFNFPGTSWDSRTRVVELPNYLRDINYEKTGEKTPQYAVTTGIATGMDSKEILTIISGGNKAEILAEILYSKPSEIIPATVLKTHDSCTWLVDEAAASLL